MYDIPSNPSELGKAKKTWVWGVLGWPWAGKVEDMVVSIYHPNQKEGQGKHDLWKCF